MRSPFNIFRHPLFPSENYVWVQIKIIHETKKAILISADPKIWIPKSEIKNIRKENGNIEIYVKERSSDLG